ncbi:MULTISPECIES: biopolymer transporter ExbD [unclassified Lentimonas]|uniref:ExbD/TolR family protein n=1 Tax=unclassified Lentimonas TaxID=2630993 RepID=UPI001321C4B5|nr:MULTISPECIES: biopolymer transporter ExbD [unclassified Lentimonas]CAA6691622.1 Biopolymer transport protein ExbD/TolR [Lentimonas sp. CC19]CAA6692242.1 Biopolymer transport protein ExbD/TolR [Lentimonas sp. CC10]CAA7070184.1 Biopolymer transport protein ExbD/TolR [Lentimonas sp. CC11]
MSLKGYKVPQEGEGFDLTPMIDVVFLLIVFFMTVASALTTNKIDLNLAVAEEAAIPKEIKDRFSFSVTDDGTFYYGVTPMTEQELSEKLAQITKNHSAVKIVLRAGRMAEHQHVNKLLTICAENGVNDIIFATYQSDL